MKAATKRLISIFAALFLIGGAAYIIFNLASPTWRRVQALRLEASQKEEVRNKLTELIAEARKLLDRFEDLDRQAQPIAQALPADPELPEVLAILGTLANANEVTLGQVNFEEIISRKTGTQGSRPKAASVRVTTTLIGRYTDFKSFLKALETELRLVDVGDVTAQPLSTKPEEGVLSFALTLQVYYQPKPELVGLPSSRE